MGIHFCKKGDNVKSLFELTDDAYNVLEQSFEKFERKTGIFIDPYGKTTLYPDNLRLLIEIIKQDISKSSSGIYDETVEIVLKQLVLLFQSNETLEAVGD